MAREPFERLYETHAETLLAFLVYRTADPSLAEDVLADTFEKVLRAKRRFDPRRGSEKTWLYTVALNQLRDHYRRRSAEGRAVERAMAGGGTTPPSETDTLEDRDALMTALERLGADEREAIALRYGGDLSLREIAKLRGVPVTTVKGRLHRGLKQLREELG